MIRSCRQRACRCCSRSLLSFLSRLLFVCVEHLAVSGFVIVFGSVTRELRIFLTHKEQLIISYYCIKVGAPAAARQKHQKSLPKISHRPVFKSPSFRSRHAHFSHAVSPHRSLASMNVRGLFNLAFAVYMAYVFGLSPATIVGCAACMGGFMVWALYTQVRPFVFVCAHKCKNSKFTISHARSTE